MTQIRHPLKRDGFSGCFACGKDNPIGLKLDFTWDGEKATAHFTAGKHHQGWPEIMHGGLVGCLLDEAMAYAVYFNGFTGLTAKTEIRIRSTIPVGEPLRITGVITRRTRKLMETAAQLFRKDGSVGAESSAVIYLTGEREENRGRHTEHCTLPGKTQSPPKAVIWDMDGVITDSGPYHLKSWQEAFATRGVRFTAAQFRKRFGQRNDNIIRATLGSDTSAEVIRSIAKDKENIYRRIVAGHISPFPGAVQLMDSLRSRGFFMAIASSAPIENIHMVLSSIGIERCFQTIVCGRDVIAGKPDPQVFLLAAERLGVEIRRCLVIEDAVAGVQAAKAAGMKCIALTSSHPAKSLARADLVVDSLTDVDAAIIERVLGAD